MVERRRKPEIVRREALEAGRRLLIASGPGAVTLKAVGGALEMSHANLIHHFGSADAFQAALKDLIVSDLTRQITALVTGTDGATPDTASIVDRVFAAYDAGGIAIMMAWSALSGAPHDEAGIGHVTRNLVAALEPRIEGPDAAARAREIVTLVTLLAFADGLIGKSLAAAVGTERAPIRAMAARLVEGLLVRD